MGGIPGEYTDGCSDSSGLIQLDEHAVADLTKTEQLEGFLNLGGDVVDILNLHDEGELGIGGNIEVSGLLGIALKLDLGTFLILVFVGVLLEGDLLVSELLEGELLVDFPGWRLIICASFGGGILDLF